MCSESLRNAHFDTNTHTNMQTGGKDETPNSDFTFKAYEMHTQSTTCDGGALEKTNVLGVTHRYVAKAMRRVRCEAFSRPPWLRGQNK